MLVKKRIRIGVTAPSSPFTRDTADAVLALSDTLFGADGPEIVFHPQCFLTENHFAGSDAERTQAALDIANDPEFDALWFARGGYGACRVAHGMIEGLAEAARDKLYLGYSDAGMILAALYRAGCRVAHGPMCQDIVRKSGERAIERALRWIVEEEQDALEPGLDGSHPAAAFNMMVLSQLLGTELEPDLDGHILLLEEVSEFMYRIDRTLHHILCNEGLTDIAGVRLGRCSDILRNDVDFGQDEEKITRFWCETAGIPYLGRADIGHDAANRIVPFGLTA